MDVQHLPEISTVGSAGGRQGGMQEASPPMPGVLPRGTAGSSHSDSPHLLKGSCTRAYRAWSPVLPGPQGVPAISGGVRLIRHEKGHICGTRARSRLSFRSQPQDLGRIAGLPEGRGGSAFRKAGTSQAGPRQRERKMGCVMPEVRSRIRRHLACCARRACHACSSPRSSWTCTALFRSPATGTWW